MRTLGFFAIVFQLALFLVGSTAKAQDLELEFEFFVSHGEEFLGPFGFGVVPEALSGPDEFDVPSPPPYPESNVFCHLEMVLPTVGFPNRWQKEIRPSAELVSKRVELWPLTIGNLAQGEDISILIFKKTLASYPYRLTLILPGLDCVEVSIPGTILITPDATQIELYWELQLDSQISSQPITLGGAKSLFR